MSTEPEAKVLLVDDRPDGLVALEAVLSSRDYRLIQARSGQEALSHLLFHEFAVILLDVQMPQMDGFQTAALIKENPQWKDIPILFVTAIHQDTPYVHEGYRKGAVDYIFKPFDPYVLQSKVAVFVDLYRKNVMIRQAEEELRRKEEELHRARKLEAIGRLAGGIAHDFNNLITGILGITQDVLETLDAGDSRRRDLDEIIKASHRAFSLTRQLLAYARRQILSPQILDLNIVVSDLREMLARLIGEDIQLKTMLDPVPGLVSADRSGLEQVLINLVINARDAMTKGGTVTVQTSQVELTEKAIRQRSLELQPGPYVLLSVDDSGCGMSDEVLPHIFEPFFTTKEKDKGTGLGLATVYGIVKQNGGDITVHSRSGVGTVMEIYLPCVAEGSPKPLSEETPLSQLRGSETILVVEDEYLVRRVVATLLRKNGYKVLEARNGSEALTLCEQRQDPIDLLITDVIMPEMNGRQLAGLITPKHPETAVLFMSGYTGDVIARRGLLEPDIDFIEKSHVSSQLAGKVRQVLNRRTQEGEPQQSFVRSQEPIHPS